MDRAGKQRLEDVKHLFGEVDRVGCGRCNEGDDICGVCLLWYIDRRSSILN